MLVHCIRPYVRTPDAVQTDPDNLPGLALASVFRTFEPEFLVNKAFTDGLQVRPQCIAGGAQAVLYECVSV